MGARPAAARPRRRGARHARLRRWDRDGVRVRSRASRARAPPGSVRGTRGDGRPAAVRHAQPRRAARRRARGARRRRRSTRSSAGSRSCSRPARALGPDHDAVAPLTDAAARRLARARLAERDAAVRRAQSPAPSELQNVWELPAELDPRPPALDDDARASVAAARRPPRPRAANASRRAPPAGRRARAHRPRPHRPRLALAARRDPAQGAPHALDRGRPARAPSRAPLQPVDRPAVRLARGGRSGAARRGSRRWRGEGRFEPIGGMWVEPDSNMPTGESLVRQLLYGQRYFARAVRRRRTRSAGCPTASASRPALPQLLRGAGIDALLHDQAVLVGDQPLPVRPVLVGGARRQPRARAHVRQPRRRLQRRRRPARRARDLAARSAARTPESLLSVGYGDGGGGADRGDGRARRASWTTSRRCPAPALRARRRVLRPRRGAARASCRSGSASSTSSSTAAR